MRYEPFTQAVSDGTQLFVHAWLPEEEPKALLLLSHGMAEHGGRYSAISRRLAGAGWAVYAPDHRGHGKTAPAGSLGRLGKGVRFSRLVDDLFEAGEEASRRHPGRPLALYGHSFGSLLAQAYAARHGAGLLGCALSGVPTPPKPSLDAAGNLIIRLGLLCKGPDAPAELPKNITFGQYNRAFAPNRTPCDWISRDQSVVDAYRADPLADFTCSYGFYRELQALIRTLYKESAMEAAPSQLPYYFFAGEQDQVIGSPEALQALAERYRAAGRPVEFKLYPGARHEVLNELDRERVEAELLAWLEARRGKARA